MIFVFGSNLAGRHGGGAAKVAREQYGAQYGVGIGRTGNCYALPTKDRHVRTMSKTAIRVFVGDFLKHAAAHPDETFQVTQIGCGLAGYTPKDIAPMFVNAPKNCQFDEAWRPWLGDEFTYWGHVA